MGVNSLGLADGGESLRERVELRPVSQNQGQVTLLSISVTASTGTESKKCTQALVEEFISYVEELSAREFASTRQFLHSVAPWLVRQRPGQTRATGPA